MEEVKLGIELFKSYGFQPKEYNTLMRELKTKKVINRVKEVHVPVATE